MRSLDLAKKKDKDNDKDTRTYRHKDKHVENCTRSRSDLAYFPQGWNALGRPCANKALSVRQRRNDSLAASTKFLSEHHHTAELM